MIGIIGYDGDETPYPYRNADLSIGFEVPFELIQRLIAAEREHDEATAAIRRYIEEHHVPEIDLDGPAEADR